MLFILWIHPCYICKVSDMGLLVPSLLYPGNFLSISPIFLLAFLITYRRTITILWSMCPVYIQCHYAVSIQNFPTGFVCVHMVGWVVDIVWKNYMYNWHIMITIIKIHNLQDHQTIVLQVSVNLRTRVFCIIHALI